MAQTANAAPSITTDTQVTALEGAYTTLLQAINAKMKLTVTVTTDLALAIQSFASLNFTGQPLGLSDVLRAYLVTELEVDPNVNNVLFPNNVQNAQQIILNE